LSDFTFTAKQIDPDSDPSGVFYSMLDMYNKIHDITPLKELLLVLELAEVYIGEEVKGVL
jgi:hypothetical protein